MKSKEVLKLLKKWGSLRAIARNTEHTYYSVRTAYHDAWKEGLVDGPPQTVVNSAEDHKIQALVESRVTERKLPRFEVPKEGIKRYIFTCAQNNTKLHEQFWENLLILKNYYDADLCISRFYYVKVGLGARGDKDEGRDKTGLYDPKKVQWDNRLIPYLLDDRVEVAPGLIWCGEMNTLPTAVDPLSGLEVYTGRKSGIFPHVKIAMRSIASYADDAVKFNYTTGTVTLRNYIQRKAGLKAEFHHCYGALLVEVDSNGDWWCRQINADDEGTIHDLDIIVNKGNLSTGNRIEAISWGDIHVEELNETVNNLAWMPDEGMLDILKPKFQFCHDILDFSVRSGHHIKKNIPFDRFRTWVRSGHSVEAEIGRVSAFLNSINRDWCKTIVVDSNHHRHYDEWLSIADWRKDIGENTIFFLESQLFYAKSILDDPRKPVNLMKWALEKTGLKKPNVQILNQDEGFLICNDQIECGMHGHVGVNGARGFPKGIANMGRRANLGHTHVAGIWDGAYYAGTCSNLRLDYNKGPSSWSHSHIITYPNSKRAIITMWKGKWRA